MIFFFRCCFWLVNNMLNKVVGVGVYVVIDVVDIFFEQVYIDKLGVDEYEQYGEEYKYFFCCLLWVKGQMQYYQQQVEGEVQQGNYVVENVEQMQWCGGQIGYQVVYQVDQVYKVVFGVVEFVFGVYYWDFYCVLGEGICQDWDKGVVFMVVEYGVDDMVVVSVQYVVVVVYCFVGGVLDQVVDYF